MSPRTILITGSNRGIGFSILQALATRSPSDRCLLAAHDLKSGIAAIGELRKLGVQAEIRVVELDVSSESSIKVAEQAVRKKYGRLDRLVDAAGIGVFEKPDHSPTKKVMQRRSTRTSFETLSRLQPAYLL